MQRWVQSFVTKKSVDVGHIFQDCKIRRWVQVPHGIETSDTLLSLHSKKSVDTNSLRINTKDRRTKGPIVVHYVLMILFTVFAMLFPIAIIHILKNQTFRVCGTERWRCPKDKGNATAATTLDQANSTRAAMH